MALRRVDPFSIRFQADETPAANQPESESVRLVELLAHGPRAYTQILDGGARVAIAKRPRSMSPNKYLDFWREAGIMIVSTTHKTSRTASRVAGPEQAMVVLSKLCTSPDFVSANICWVEP